jgi:prephenate dehydratase
MKLVQVKSRPKGSGPWTYKFFISTPKNDYQYNNNGKICELKDEEL